MGQQKIRDSHNKISREIYRDILGYLGYIGIYYMYWHYIADSYGVMG